VCPDPSLIDIRLQRLADLEHAIGAARFRTVGA
jgi:hypothetical protein